MPGSDFDQIFAALEAARVRYLVVGGVAVLLHGSLRFTADLDLVIALDRENIIACMHALGGLGYRPRAPVVAEQFADPEVRRQWIEEKGLTVFSLWSAVHPTTDVDLFVAEPFPFVDALARAIPARLGATTVTVASIDDLIALKQKAGRAKDFEDIRALQAIRETKRRG